MRCQRTERERLTFGKVSISIALVYFASLQISYGGVATDDSVSFLTPFTQPGCSDKGRKSRSLSASTFTSPSAVHQAFCFTSGKVVEISKCMALQSGIHGWGLFARKKLKQDSMVMEYRGDLLRRTAADAREKAYQAAGKDCYLFTVNEDCVIDATMTGGIGRFTVRSSEALVRRHMSKNCRQ